VSPVVYSTDLSLRSSIKSLSYLDNCKPYVVLFSVLTDK